MVMPFPGVSKKPQKVVWKDTSQNVLGDLNRTSSLDWTDLDLTASTSPNAKFAILNLRSLLDSYTDGQVNLDIRKNGTAPSYTDRLWASNAAESAKSSQAQMIAALDSGQVVEYKIYLGGTAQVDSWIDVLGYIE